MSEYANTSTADADIVLGDWTFEGALEAYEQTLEACRVSLADNEARERQFAGAIAKMEQSVEDSAARERQYKKALASYEQALEESSTREHRYKDLLYKRESEDLNWIRAMMREIDVDQVIESLAQIKDRLRRRMLAVQADSDEYLDIAALDIAQGPAPHG